MTLSSCRPFSRRVCDVFSLSLIGLACLLLSASIAGAQGSPDPHSYTYYREFTEPANCAQASNGQNGRAGWIKTFFAKYHVLDKDFTIDVLFERCDQTGALANGYWAVFNSGPNPKGHAGELAILYVDARDADNPILNFFGYNGVSSSYYDGFRNDDHDGVPGMPGVQTPDRILSNLQGDDFVVEAEVTQPNPNQRRIHLRFSVAFVNSWTPLWEIYGVDWAGMQFNNLFGAWFHPAQLNDNTEYCEMNEPGIPCGLETGGIFSAGYLKHWGYDYKGWFDTANRPANGSPSCEYEVTGPAPYNPDRGCYELNVGDTIGAWFTLVDGEGDDFEVRYNHGLPDEANFDPPGPIENFTGTGMVNMNWTASAQYAGGFYPLWLMITDEHQAMAECGIDVCVNENNPPKCVISFNEDNPEECEGEITRVDFTSEGTHDPDGDSLIYSWETDCPDGVLDLNTGKNGQALSGSLVLEAPGNGEEVSGCSVQLTVDDSYNEPQSCALDIHVDPCDLDCLNQPNGDAKLDECGVCEGDGTSCADCEGTPNGGKQIDVCGVCDGDGSSCLDCAGEPNGTAVEDECGVCNGNGLSCADCSQTDIAGLQLAGDSRSIDIARTIRQEIIARTVRYTQRTEGEITKKLRRWARRNKGAAQALHVDAWAAIYTPDQFQTTCGQDVSGVCVTVSNVSALAEYSAAMDALVALANKTGNRLRRAAEAYFLQRGRTERAARRRANRLVGKPLTRIDGFYTEGIAAANSIPSESVECGS